MTDKSSLPERSVPAQELLNNSKAGWLLLIAAIIIAIVYYWPEKKPTPPVQPQAQSAVQTRIVAVSEYPWTPVDLTSGLWFDLHAAIDPDKAFWIQLEDGRKFVQRGTHLYDAAGKRADNCMGKNIGNRLLLAADKGQGEFEILITFWPKNPLNVLDGKECEGID